MNDIELTLSQRDMVQLFLDTERSDEYICRQLSKGLSLKRKRRKISKILINKLHRKRVKSLVKDMNNLKA